MLMMLKYVCEREGWSYARVRYALATGKVKSAKMIGRSWMLAEADVRALRSVLARTRHRCKTNPAPQG